MRAVVVCILLVAGLAGCADRDGDVDREEVAGLAGNEPTFRYLCPGANADGGREPCPTTLTTEPTVEPAVAMDPIDSRRLAVAAGVGVATGSPSVRGCVLTVWTSGDAGAHWEAMTPALPPLEGAATLGSRCPHSPSLAFDGMGRLHLVAFDSVTDISGTQPLVARTFHTRSADLGRTWGAATVLFEDSNHPWIAVAPDGTIVVTSRSGAWAKVARSTDAGMTWTRHEPPETAGCILPSRPAPVGNELLFACARYEGSGPRGRIEVFRVDARDGTVEVRGSVPFADTVETSVQDDLEYARPYLVGFPDGRAVLHFTFYGLDRTDAYLATSPDGGRTWEPTVAAAVLLGRDGLEVDVLHASGPQGSTHLWALLSDGATTDVEHVVLDRAGAVAERRFLASGLRPATVPSDATLKGLAYSGAGLAWSGETGLIAWEHPDDGPLRVVRLAARAAA